MLEGNPKKRGNIKECLQNKFFSIIQNEEVEDFESIEEKVSFDKEHKIKKIFK